MGSVGHVVDAGASRTRYVELVFLHPVGCPAHVVRSGVSGEQNVDTLFFMVWWAHCDFHIKCARKHYTELVFLHPVGSVGHVVHSGVTGA
jgi:hypothetical protein